MAGAAFGRCGPALGAVAVPIAVAWRGGVRAAVSALVVLHLAFGAVERCLRRLAVGRGGLGWRGAPVGAALGEGAEGEEGERRRRDGGDDDIGFHGFTVLMG